MASSTRERETGNDQRDGDHSPAGARRQEPEPPQVQSVRQVLEFQRWESRDGPFTGFGSPPGKF